MHSDTDEHPYVLKILFGPLSGLDLPLAHGRHFFVTSPAASAPVWLEDSALAQISQSYVVPGSVDSTAPLPNFAIVFDNKNPSAEGHDESISVEIFEHDSCENPRFTKPAACFADQARAGEVFSFRGLRFAWNYRDRPWPQLDNTPATPHAAIVARQPMQSGAPGSSFVASDGRERVMPRKRSLTRRWLLLTGLSVVAGIAAASMEVKSEQSSSTSLESLKNVLQSAAYPAEILHGRDNLIYILVKSLRDETWVTQALRNVPVAHDIRVRIQREESERVEALLERETTTSFAVRFASGSQTITVVRIADTRPDLTDDALRQTVLAALPYVIDVRIEHQTTASVVARARSGLDAHDIRYRQVMQSPYPTFELDPSLDDTRLSALSDFVHRFTQDWGQRSVRFVFAAPDNTPQQGSYRFGTHNYSWSGRDAIAFTSPVL